MLGLAAGLYWPAIEYAVPNSCGKFSLGKGFALVRSADALGISLGVLAGSISASLNSIKSIYFIDIFCLIILIKIISNQNFKVKNLQPITKTLPPHISNKKLNYNWIKRIVPILIISLFATSISTLMQSILPLDLVLGGISRPSMSEGISGALITIQLMLLVFLQWPIGKWLAFKKLRFGLRISLLSFGFGCLLIGLSGLLEKGIIVVIFAQLPLAFGLASFFPTATESIIRQTSSENKGVALALFSQCFAISGLFTPILGGKLLDNLGNGMALWLIMSTLSFLLIVIVNQTND